LAELGADAGIGQDDADFHFLCRRSLRHDRRCESKNGCEARNTDSIILAEANVLPRTDMNYFGAEGDRMQMTFNFQVNQNLFYALAAADARPLVKAMIKTKTRPPTSQMGQFSTQSR
jgi:hypothetical protein